MSKRKITLAINNIAKYLELFRQNVPNSFNKTLKTLGFHSIVTNECYPRKIYRLGDLEEALDCIDALYDFNEGRLTTLARNVKSAYNKCLEKEQGIVSKPKRKKQQISLKQLIAQELKKSPKISKKLVERIKRQSNGKCCYCSTIKELSKIDESTFVAIMKSQYRAICNQRLEKSQIQSWRDEYRQLIRRFLPLFKRYDKDIMDFHIVFEYKLPLELKDLKSNNYVYPDALIVADNGFVVLEFKQRNNSVAEIYQKQTMKYVHRLRYHKIGCHQKLRYGYMVATKEDDCQLYYFKGKKDFWFGNPDAVADDLCSRFFVESIPCFDIGQWLNAGFWEKKK